MKLAIIGNRTCPPIDIEACLKYIPDTVVSGDVLSADTYEFAGKSWAKLIAFFPNYDKYGKQAPLQRKRLIVEECDCVLVFWDGQSYGTKFTICYAIEKVNQ